MYLEFSIKNTGRVAPKGTCKIDHFYSTHKKEHFQFKNEKKTYKY